MAMDMNPAVGRIVLGRGTTLDFYPWYTKAGRITRVAGKRIHYKTEDGTEHYLLAYSAIVDTTDEEGELLAFSARGRKMVDDLLAALYADSENVLLQMSQPKPSPSAPVLKRVRKPTA